eukprot:gnl/TRDRNA2_/TRDRNA2_151675_c0_seq2.p1 gnl/TRDRNA2_/TRDRNA2_151675_c0~~gnl/TRDRNA2_/TRDRNA2_151675_c0_seq2.p1  ORF type:complete len:459 (+),score=58.15 gnl/TRDRNA2_/TRDRNA2_151675_c0_seq2:126-1502(+)
MMLAPEGFDLDECLQWPLQPELRSGIGPRGECALFARRSWGFGMGFALVCLGPRSASREGSSEESADNCLELNALTWQFDEVLNAGESQGRQWNIVKCTASVRHNTMFFERSDGRLCVTSAHQKTWCVRPFSVEGDRLAADMERALGGPQMQDELEQWTGSGGNLRSEHRWAWLAQTIESARVRSLLVGSQAESKELQAPECPPSGAGVGSWRSETDKFHHLRHTQWATFYDFCRSGQGLWTGSGGASIPVHYAAIADTVVLRPGQLVLDVGSGCGHAALWLHRWYGARTIGVDFVEEAVEFARDAVSPAAPASFCWFNVATEGLGFVPAGSIDLATAVSVLHYLRTDADVFGLPDWPANRTAARTPCHMLMHVKQTQCFVAREMFHKVRVGGHAWIAHNGCYKGKWDPRRVWGPQYWRCCFGPELQHGYASLHEVSERDLFLKVIVRRLKAETGQAA